MRVPFAYVLVILLATLNPQSIGLAADTSNGATDFTFHGKGAWWRNIGSQQELTNFSGPFLNATKHPGEIYMTFWKELDSTASNGISSALDPKKIQVLHSLGTTFFYPAGQTTPPDPATIGYTAQDFVTADKLFAQFPAINDIFPNGVTTSGCQRDGVQYFLIRGNGSSVAFLVDWVAKNETIDVAVLPSKALDGSFESILDNINYYSSGGMVELMEFGGHYFYLSHLPQSAKFDVSPSGTAAGVCPEMPEAGSEGIEYPASWTEAVKGFDKRP